jgi:ADP-ribosylglycohydrolase
VSTPSNISKRDRILGGLWGSLVGDALGVPVEFINRETVQHYPVTDMRGYGTHDQPPGTWSDDGAMILCTVDSLLNHEFNLADLGDRFLRWMDNDLWTATGIVFDVGGTTSGALRRISNGIPAEQAGGQSEECNGNGSLMRIIPAVLRFADEPTAQFASRIEKISAITHGHARSRMACAFYGLVIRSLVQGWNLKAALDMARAEFSVYERAEEFKRFRHILEDDFTSLPQGEILSTGYVLHTLHASLWCLFTTSSFEECVLKAVNLGGDTDTTGCVAGGLAGVHYGMSAIPEKWIRSLPRHDEVETLFNQFAELILASK